MSTKKNLKKRAAADHQKILDENQEFHDALIREHYFNDETKKSKKKSYMTRWKLSLTVTAILVLAVTATLLGIYLPIDDDGGLDDAKDYLNENIMDKEVSLIELQENVNWIEFSLNNYVLEPICLFYDSASNDQLYYRLNGADEDGLEEWTIEIEVNDDYKLPYAEDKYTETFSFEGRTVKYYSSGIEDDGIYFITTNAYIEHDGKNIYFKYECIAFDENDNTFFDWLNVVISFK